jgi:GDPmannose 4,6-dehydratase
LPRALITGLSGQDGSYLAELLLHKGYEVHGIVRKASTFNTHRVSHLYVDPHRGGVSFFIHYAELSDTGRLSPLVAELRPDEIYHLGAQSHVRVSFDIPEYTSDITGLGTLRVLEAIRRTGVKAKFYQASSSELFGASPPPQNETTPFYPRSPYAAAKAFAYWVTVNYREAYGIYACNGILFNHESPRRGETFVTRKITRAVANIKAGLQHKLYLGNLDARRDWGFAPEYVECQWLMLQQERPDDFVVGTGDSHTVREFVEAAFSYADLDWKQYVEIDSRYLRPTEVDYLRADISKARTRLGWSPRVSFDELVKIMVDADLRALGQEPPGEGERALRDKGLAWFEARHLGHAQEETMAHSGSFR